MIRKTAVILGASGGIGMEIAKDFAKKGYNLGLTYYENNIEDLAKELADTYSIEVNCRCVDARDSKKIKDAVNHFKNTFGTIDAGILAFGVADKQSLLIDKDDEAIKRVIEINLIGSIYANRELCNIMLHQKYGIIVNISSVIGVHGASCESAYAASKAGMIGLTKSIAKEFGQFGIRINSVSPGFIDTKMCECFDEEGRQNIKENTVLSRLGNVSDVSKVVAFLCSDDAKFITGENIEVSGGLKL